MIFSGEYIGVVCLLGLVGVYFLDVFIEKNNKAQDEDSTKKIHGDKEEVPMPTKEQQD